MDLNKPYHWTSTSIANMLENELYLGNTLNLQYSTKSYKDKRKAEHPREECLVFENTHPALVTQEVWDIVQQVRQHKRRRTKVDGQNKYSGMVVCRLRDRHGAAPGAYHVCLLQPLHLRTYKKEGAEVCTVHYIRECILGEVILEDLRRVTALVREHTQEFAAYIGSRQTTEVQREVRVWQREPPPELLRLFIWKIVVHEKDIKWSKHAQQTVEIYYNDIGCVGADAGRETDPQEPA